MGPSTVYDRTTRAITSGSNDSPDDGSLSAVGFFVAFIVIPIVVILFVCCFMACRLVFRCSCASCESLDCSCSCCCCCCRRNRRQRRATNNSNNVRGTTTTATTTNTSGVAVSGARRPATDNDRTATNTSSVFTISWDRSRDHSRNGLHGCYNGMCLPPSYDEVITSTTAEDHLPPYESVVSNWDEHEHPPPKDDTEPNR